jgi:methyl acetate hydrolase
MRDAIDALLSEAVDRGDVPGVAVAVVGPDGPLYEGAHGVRRLGADAPMTLDTVAAIMSMTKPLTGLAAMQLVEQGRLDLDAPAGDVVPYLGEVEVLVGFDGSTPHTRPPATPVTLRHLLTHTSGFVYDIWNRSMAKWAKIHDTPSVMTRKLASIRVPLMFDPGERWEYGVGIDWAGLMVEAVTGQTLGEYMRQNVLDPLGMSDTTFAPTAAQAARAASIHQRAADDSLSGSEFRAPTGGELDLGGGGLYSTVDDYASFVATMLGDGAGGGGRLLRPETVELMARNNMGENRVTALTSAAPQLSNDVDLLPGVDKTWGLSFQINEDPTATGRPRGGLSWGGLANSYFWIDRTNRIGGVFITQILPFADVRALPLFYAVERAVYDDLASVGARPAR